MSEHDEAMEGVEEPAELEELARAEDLTGSEERTSDNTASEQAAPEEAAAPFEEEGEPRVEAEAEVQTVEGEFVAMDALESAAAQEKIPPVDLNTATEEDLQQLPGIGEVLAARIVAYRTANGPFREPAEIMQVSGVSDVTYGSLAERLIVTGPEVDVVVRGETEDLAESAAAESPVEEPPEPEPAAAELPAGEPQEVEPEGAELLAQEPLEPEPEAVESEPMLVPEPGIQEAEVKEKPPRGPEPPLVEVVRAPFPWGRLLFFSLTSTILGAALALVILYALNGTLNFRGAAERAVQVEIQRVEGEMDTLRNRLGEVEGRLGAIQELDARLTDTERALQQIGDELASTQAQIEEMTTLIGSLQQEFTNLREDLDGLAEHVSSLAGHIVGLQEQVDGLQKDLEAVSRAAERFDAFLNGLRELLGESEGQSSPVPTIEPALTGTPTSRQAPTLRPLVTVIPLVTPSATP